MMVLVWRSVRAVDGFENMLTHYISLNLLPPHLLHKISQAVKAAIAGAAVTAGVAVSPAFAGDVGAGEQVFNANCAACHAGGQNVIMPDKTLEKLALETYLAGGRNEKAVITQVTNGKNAMPSFGGRLTEEQIADVASYVIATSEKGWEE
jgi:cytochrome c6